MAGSLDKINTISLSVEFQDAAGTLILRAVAPGPDPTDIHLAEGLLPRSVSGFLPPNVRKAKVTIDLAVGESGGNAFAADNISLVLTTDPMTGVNLIVNGDGETPTGSEDGLPVPGWNSHTDLLVWKYGEYKMPKSTDPGPSNRGAFFFNCYTSNLTCKAYQRIDISAAAKTIDSSGMTYSLSGWLGGDTNWPDNAALAVIFYDSQGKAMTAGSASAGPVTMADRNGQIGLWQRSAAGAVPAGARLAQVTLTFTKLGPVTDNLIAYADNIAFTLDVLQVTTVVNGGSWQTGAIAPGEFVTIGGSGLGPATPAISKGVEKNLSGTRVFFNNIEAFLTYTSSNQVNALAPYGLAAPVDLTVQYGGRTSDPFPLQLATSSPGIFTQNYGAGQAWAVNNDGSFNAKDKPVARGGWIEFWATGQGTVDPAGQDGEGISGFKNLTQAVKSRSAESMRK